MFNVPITRRRFFFAEPHFQSSWEGYDKVRNTLEHEPNENWKRFENKMREQPCMASDLIESDLDYYGGGGSKYERFLI